MDGGDVYVSHASILGQDGEKGYESVLMILGLVVVNDARLLYPGFTNRMAHCLVLVAGKNHCKSGR